MAQQVLARPSVVIIGTGGIGLAIARRVSNGRLLILADHSLTALESAASTLTGAGFDVETHTVDVAQRSSVQHLVDAVAAGGEVEVVVHAAGVSPNQAEPKKVLEVDLVGTANVVDCFYEIARPGLSMVCVASIAGHMGGNISPELEKHLAIAPTDQLLQHPEIDLNSPRAYSISKKANMLRVKAVAKSWGLKGARINTVSPGIISTPMTKQEQESGSGEHIKQLLGVSSLMRMGTPDDIASMVAFLVGPESRYITGSDFVIDGGVVAGLASQSWAS